jgi:hypothetical protein
MPTQGSWRLFVMGLWIGPTALLLLSVYYVSASTRQTLMFMVEVIEKRLVGRIWDEISAMEARAEGFLSREFITHNADGKPRSVDDFGHLSDHYDRISTKNETLEGFSASAGQGSVEWRDPGAHSSRLHVRHSSGSLWRAGYEVEQHGGAIVVD